MPGEAHTACPWAPRDFFFFIRGLNFLWDLSRPSIMTVHNLFNWANWLQSQLLWFWNGPPPPSPCCIIKEFGAHYKMPNYRALCVSFRCLELTRGHYYLAPCSHVHPCARFLAFSLTPTLDPCGSLQHTSKRIIYGFSSVQTHYTTYTQTFPWLSVKYFGDVTECD